MTKYVENQNSACFLSKMLPSDCYLKRGIHRVFMYLRRLK